MEHKVCNSFNNMYEADFCITTFIDFVSDFLGGKGNFYQLLYVLSLFGDECDQNKRAKTDSHTIL